jgi:glutathione S-transferase
MKLYDYSYAPNPRRVRMFLAEKGIQVPTVQVDIMKGEQKQPEYRKIAPNGLLPALELDDGTVILESVAICRYFEGMQPSPPLMGVDPLDAAIVEMWQRRMEFELLMPMGMTFRNTHPLMAASQRQFPEFGEAQRKVAERRLTTLDAELADREFIAGKRFSIADITAFCTIDFFKLAEFRIAEDQKNLKRWFDATANRPSAKA